MYSNEYKKNEEILWKSKNNLLTLQWTNKNKMEEKQVVIKLTADENFVADALRKVATYIENAESTEEIDGAELENAHYMAEINVEY